MTFLEAQQDLCRHLNFNFTALSAGLNDLFTLDDIKDFIDTANKRAWDYKPWIFTKKTYKATSIADSDAKPVAYYDYPQDFEDESVYPLSVAGVPYRKVDWESYMSWFAQNPLDVTKLWCEQGRFYFINRNSYSVGDEINVTGKLRAPSLSSDSDLLLFSPTTDNQESSGNHAVVMFAYSDALSSDKLKRQDDSELRDKEAKDILDALWKPIAERRAKEQSQDRPFFNVPDFFAGHNNGRNTNIGNFP